MQLPASIADVHPALMLHMSATNSNRSILEQDQMKILWERCLLIPSASSNQEAQTIPTFPLKSAGCLIAYSLFSCESQKCWDGSSSIDRNTLLSVESLSVSSSSMVFAVSTRHMLFCNSWQLPWSYSGNQAALSSSPTLRHPDKIRSSIFLRTLYTGLASTRQPLL